MQPRQAQEQDMAAPASGRQAQRRRTRAAIVEAATRLLTSGLTPTVDDIAAAADVSRRTVYMHFPTLDQLLLDAAVGAMSDAVLAAALDEVATSDDVLASVDALVCALVATAPTTLGIGRKIIALTVDSPRAEEDGPRRGYRRVAWIERALAPARDHLDPPVYERLVSALTVVVGWEAMIVLRDLRAASDDEELATIRWAARALVQAALASTS